MPTKWVLQDGTRGGGGGGGELPTDPDEPIHIQSVCPWRLSYLYPPRVHALIPRADL